MICKKSIMVRAGLAWTVYYILHTKVFLTTSNRRSGISVPRFFYYKIILGGTEKENQWLRPTQIRDIKMKKTILFFTACIMVSIMACSQNNTITYSVDGERPQEKYSVKLEQRNIPSVQLHFYRDEAVKAFKHRSNSRPMIAEEFLIAIMYTNGIACGDAMYNFIPKKETYTYSVEFKEEVVPD